MTNLSREFCFKIRNIRRERKISQCELAAEVGCNQSAISALEQGDGTKLNDEVINKIAKKFDVAIEEEVVRDPSGLAPGRLGGAWGDTSGLAAGQGGSPASGRERTVWGYCPNPECPSNHGYEVGGKRFLRPQREEADPVGGRYCAICGEVLNKTCPNCGAAIHEGAVCSHCGEPYITLI